MENTTFLFFNMGPMEVVVIMFVVLMFFGSESIPKIARGLGRGIRQVKDAADEIKQDIRESAEGTTRKINEQTKELEEPFKEDKNA